MLVPMLMSGVGGSLGSGERDKDGTPCGDGDAAWEWECSRVGGACGCAVVEQGGGGGGLWVGMGMRGVEGGCMLSDERRDGATGQAGKCYGMV